MAAGNARATIDPNHTAAVEGGHYLSASTPAQQHAVETVIEDAQHDLLRRAHPSTVITEDDAAALAEGYPQLLATMNLDDDTIAELVGGALDVFTVACADQLAGLRGPPGKPCPARPWVRLLCPLATEIPAAFLARTLGIHTDVAVSWQRLSAGDWTHYAAEVSRRPKLPATAGDDIGWHDEHMFPFKAFPALSRMPRRDELAMHIKAGGMAFESQAAGRQVAWIRRANDGAWMAVCTASVHSGNVRSRTTMQLWLEPDTISQIEQLIASRPRVSGDIEEFLVWSGHVYSGSRPAHRTKCSRV